MKPGDRYNWKNQPERLVYIGLCEPRNGPWHQFAKVENPNGCGAKFCAAICTCSKKPSKVAKMNSQVNKEKLTQIADHLQLLIEDLGDEGRDVDSEICIKAHDALRNIIATHATIPDADHSEDVRAMVVPEGYKLVPIEPTAAQCFTAAFNLCNEFGDEFVRDNKQFALAAYRSLVAASPSAKGGE